MKYVSGFARNLFYSVHIIVAAGKSETSANFLCYESMNTRLSYCRETARRVFQLKSSQRFSKCC